MGYQPTGIVKRGLSITVFDVWITASFNHQTSDYNKISFPVMKNSNDALITRNADKSTHGHLLCSEQSTYDYVMNNPFEVLRLSANRDTLVQKLIIIKSAGNYNYTLYS